MELTTIITVVGVLVALTNIFVEVLKKATYDKIPTNIVALIVSEVLTLAAGVAYSQINGIAIAWYMIVGFLIGGFMVAYAAMFGFDKLKEVMNWGKSDE